MKVVKSDKLRGGRTQSCGCVARERIANLNKGKSLVADLKGRRFGRLTVLEFSHLSDDRKRTYWKCKCDCGNEIITRADGIKSGHTNSCGCYNKDILQNAGWNITHGLSHSRVYGIWRNMKARCYNDKSISYEYYGKKGITVCDEWLGKGGFKNFYDWSMENGYRDDLTIDRKDNDKGYSPDNCRWVAYKEQANNKSTNVCIEYNGETNTISEWADKCGLEYSCLLYRLHSGWDIEKALTTPSRKRTKNNE